MKLSFDKTLESSRRDFLKGITALPLVSMLTGRSWNASSDASTIAPLASAVPKNEKRLVAIQVGARSFVDEGVDSVLDVFNGRLG